MARRMVSVLSGLALAVAPHFHAAVQGQEAPAIELVSVGTDGVSGNHQSGSDGLLPARTRISADGRWVAFESYASTLVCEDNDFSTRDVFVRDRLTGRATVVSVASDGGEGNQDSFDPVISADGRFVAFSSLATNLVPGSTNGFVHIFLRDLQAGTTTRLSVSTTGEQSNSVSHAAAISADGRYVAFHSGGSNLAPGDTNNTHDVFVRDVQAGTTERVSVSSAGVESSCCSSLYPTITADGRYVAFLSQGRLDPSVNNNWQEIYIRDRTAGTTTLVRPAANGDLSSSGIRFADLSADGRFVAFMSGSTNIVVPDQNGGVNDVFLKDLVNGTTTLVSRATDGTWGNHDSWMPSLSADGRYVAFHSWANNLVPGDTNTSAAYDIFLRDTQLGTTTRLNLPPTGGEADGTSLVASISADGSLVSFESTATNLGPNDLVNGFQDVFVAGPSYPGGGGTSFQFGSASIEAAESAGRATVTVTRHGRSCTPATVQFATADGTATAGADYLPAAGTLSFLADEASKVVEIGLLDDGLEDPGETILLTLSNPTGGPALGNPSTATVVIVDDDAPVNRPPDAVEDAAVTSEDVPAAIPVRANDSDPDGDPVTVTAFTQGAHGAVADDGTGLLIYTPFLNFAGTDTFQYTVGDGNGASDTALVQVTVTPVNDLPVAAADQYTMTRDETLNVPRSSGVLANDVDPDGDTLTAVVVDAPAQGALALAPDGSFTYAPPEGFAGPVTFTYQARDPQMAASMVTSVRVAVQSGEVPVSTCRPVTPAAFHRVKSAGVDFMGEPFVGNRRLALIEDGTVPCVEVDTLETTRCAFWTADDPTSRTRRASGPWMEDAEGRRWAVVGQPVTRDGRLSHGAFIVGTTPDADGGAPCLASSGQDSVGIHPTSGWDSSLPEGTDLAATGMVESLGSETNFSGMLLQNVADLVVGTTSIPHPDGAVRVGFDPSTGIAWYMDIGAAVNDVNGERDGLGFYYGADWSYHLVSVNGVQVPAAKRPSTRSYPPPAQVDFRSRLRWLPVNPYVNIANGPSLDPRVAARPWARFKPSVSGSTLTLDASASQGDIRVYSWDLEWTSERPDASSASPTAQFPLALETVPPSGVVSLLVLSPDGQQDLAKTTVVLRPAPIAQFTAAVDVNTLWVDASGSQGDIVQYSWNLHWTPTGPDAVTTSPTAEFSLAFEGAPPSSGDVTLTVTARDGQTGTHTKKVRFRNRTFPSGAGAAPAN